MDILEAMGLQRLRWDQLAQNRTRRFLVCLCVDASASMSIDGRMDTVNSELRNFLKKENRDSYVRDALELCLVSFGNGAQVKLQFGSLEEAAQADLTIQPTGSLSALGAGVRAALEQLDSRMKTLEGEKIACYRPLLILISDGEATDKRLCAELGREIRDRIRAETLHVNCLSFGGQSEGAGVLAQFTIDGKVSPVDRLRVMDFFDMLSRSLSQFSRQSLRRGELELSGGF